VTPSHTPLLDLADAPALAEGLARFAAGEWFEAHEVLELLWRPLPKGPDRHFVQGLIQLAVALEHWRRGNPRGARGQWDKARGHLAGLPDVYARVHLAALMGDFEVYWSSVGLDRPPDGTEPRPPVPRRA